MASTGRRIEDDPQRKLRVLIDWDPPGNQIAEAAHREQIRVIVIQVHNRYGHSVIVSLKAFNRLFSVRWNVGWGLVEYLRQLFR